MRVLGVGDWGFGHTFSQYFTPYPEFVVVFICKNITKSYGVIAGCSSPGPNTRALSANNRKTTPPTRVTV